MLARGVWTQDRLFRAGLVQDPICKLCGGPGTLKHRLYHCPAHALWRDMYWADMPLMYARVKNSQAPMHVRPFVPSFEKLHPPPLLTCEPKWDVVSASLNATFSGDICGDGSGLHVQTAAYKRCGWAACKVVHNEEGPGIVTQSFYGPLPGLHQDVPKSELYGFYMVLLTGTLPINCHTDCSFVSDGYALGPKVTCRSDCPFADL